MDFFYNITYLQYSVIFLDKLHDTVKENIGDLQRPKKESYTIRRPVAGTILKVGDMVLLKNLRRANMESDWSLVGVGPYVIHKIINNKMCILTKNDKILKTVQLISNIEKYDESKSDNIEHQQFNNNLPQKFENDNISCDEQYNDIKPTAPVQETISKQYFNPVGKTWQQQQCRNLNLKLIQPFENSRQIKALTAPSDTKQIIGDGNCFYRALSYWITGIEDNHFSIRQQIYKVIFVYIFNMYIIMKQVNN